MGSSTKTNSSLLEPPSPSVCPAGAALLPENIDMDVFSQLPEDIKKEILQSPQTMGNNKNIQSKPSASATGGIQNFFTRGKMGPQVSPTRGEGRPQDTDQSPLKKYLRKDQASASSASQPSCPQDTEPNTGSEMDCTEPGDSGPVSSLPRSIDVNVFSQLPSELQKELMSEWKNQKLTPKIQTKKVQEKGKTSKGQRPGPASHPNNLLKYFKPS
ncbi:hypothetical protein GDO81_027214 [Engystomops pustulosus]|uniref:Uncharacterized protein n=1 Tax=Engystomops pustulosus TaxID=76066 RepID=A0AAV6YFQ4_ENGPU|nr:hypothetical protein GDO81_027214 [Engystomops pustulosus]